MGATFNATVLCCVPILYYGTEAQKRRFGTPLIRLDYVAGSIGITEPDAGSEVSSLSTSLVRDGDQWVINGKKRYIGLKGLDCGEMHFDNVRLPA